MVAFYLGIDASKGYADFVILDHEKLCVEPNFQLDDTFDGHHQLYDILSRFLKERPDARLYAAAESTGGYENNWLSTLHKFQGSLNIQTARVNPAGVNATGKAALNRNGTDKMSARTVGIYLIHHPGKVTYQQADPFASLRKQWTFYQMLVKQRTQLYNQLESLMYSACPEVLAWCKGGVREWVLKLLVAYPTSARLSRGQAKTVANIPYISLDRAAELIGAAKQSVASAVDPTTEAVIKATATQILHLNQVADQQIKLMSQACHMDEIKILTSFPGIALVSAIGLMIELQAAPRFKSSKNLSAFFGVHPVYKQSGDGSWGIRMSKQGRKEPRQILFMVTLSAIRCNPLIKELYETHVQNGMDKMAAVGLCMHKILRIIFGMLKNNTPFDPDIDRKNKKRSKPIAAQPQKDKNRRYQTHDQKAPISSQQAAKRKKMDSTVPSKEAMVTTAQVENTATDDEQKNNAKNASQSNCQRAKNVTTKDEIMTLIEQILA